ncbi:MAG: DUF4437 domain-containing protein [Cyanobacteria bacterium J06642_3]
MKNIKTFSILALTILIITLGSAQVLSHSLRSTSKVLLASELLWSPLNPARGDASPQAATIWGDRNGTEATGYLVKFKQGFSSPPHIHNVTYRGVVIDGLVHNDDPKAKNMWMPKGSFWTQPAGEAHITSAEEKSNIAYIEIDEGPYLVQPQEEAFDNGERPVNVDASNIVWLNAANLHSGDREAPRLRRDRSRESNSLSKPQVAFLWGNPQDEKPYGSMIKLPTGFKGEIRNYGSDFHAVVIEGQPEYLALRGKETKTLEPGSYFSSSGKAEHKVFCQAREECILYVRAEGQFDVVPI